jgi:hypothetical protein
MFGVLLRKFPDIPPKWAKNMEIPPHLLFISVLNDLTGTFSCVIIAVMHRTS